MTFDLLVGGAVKWAWRTGQEFTMYFWFAYFLWNFSSLEGVRRRQAYVAYCPNLVIIYHSKAISGLVLFCWKIGKMIVTDGTLKTLTDGTPLKMYMYTKWEILKYLFLVSKCFIFTSSKTDLVSIDWET